MGVNRLEAFSDGVIAVAITLLVLNLQVPPLDSTRQLGAALGSNWAEYVAYAVSFVTIGIIWINHHVMIGRLQHTDHSILMLNLLLLMSIVILPFATSLMTTYLHAPGGHTTAAAIYGGALATMGLLFSALNSHILLRRPHLLYPELPLQERRRILARATAGVLPYLVATGLAFVSPYATLVICGAVAAFYALPLASGLR